MIRIALVGNIASGKSTVEKILTEKYGYSVLDTDKACHFLLKKLSAQITKEFKNYDILDDSGELSREKLGKVVFYNEDLKKKLENILYPNLRVEINNYFEEHKTEEYVFVAIPLLFEAKMEDLFDKIMFVYCEDKIRLERLIERNNFSREYAQKRLDSQLSQDKKIEKSDIIINNNSDKIVLEQEIFNAIKKI
mgnify:CR=1 FL=1